MNPIGSGNRPPSGSGNRPASGARMSSYGQPAPTAGVGMSLNTRVEVQARPTVMREGMKGMQSMQPQGGGRVGTASGWGPERKVVDRSYYIGLLRPKVAELTAELERLRGQEEQINKNSSMLVQLQAKTKTANDEISRLKAHLADVNFAVEKSVSSDGEQINQESLQMQKNNADQRRAVDKLFLQVKEIEALGRQKRQQLGDQAGILENNLSSDPRVLQEYRELRDKAYRVSDEVLNMQHELRLLGAKKEALMGQFNQEPDKRRAAALMMEVLQKRSERDEMSRECAISIDEERQLLIRQAKSTAQDIDVLQRQIAEGKDEIQSSKNRVAAINEDLNEYQGENTRKYQELQEKDQEMQEFIDTFKDKEAQELDRIKAQENLIQQLLEHIAKSNSYKDTIPADNAPERLRALNEEKGAKEKQLQYAASTHARLEQELDARKAELDKVASLDEKITTELEAMSKKMEEQKDEIQRYADLDALRAKVETRKKELVGRKAVLLKLRDTSKPHINALSKSVETKTQQLNENDSHTTLATQEAKLRVIWQNVFSLEEFVRSREKETQYQPLKADCLRLTEECNTILRDPKRFEAPMK